MEKWTKVIISITVLLAIVWGVLTISGFNHKTVTYGEVTNLDIKRTSDKSDTYMVYVESDNGKVTTFENKDSFFAWKFNSSDIYGSLKKGGRYEFKTYGYRIPFFSQYKNIISVKEID